MAKPPFSLLIKPGSGSCNLRCEYCFYREKLSLFQDKAARRMTPATLQAMVEKFMGLRQETSLFSWQGGEPLVLGLPFYRQVVEFQKRYGKGGQSVGNSIQTNGLLIDDAWCDFFNEYRFLIGLSLDGPAEIHNTYRKDKIGGPVFDRVLLAMETLQRKGVEFNVLTVISRANVKRAAEVYRFLKKLGILYHQYIPAIQTPGTLEREAGFAITGEEYGHFLLDLFHEWQASDIRTVSIRFFDAVVNALLTGQANYCEVGKSCDSYLVVEHNGDIFPCDFFVEKPQRLGNINKQTFEELQNHPRYQAFKALKMGCGPECQACEYFGLCHGGCVRHRDYTGMAPQNKTVLCDGIKMFFKETLPTFKALAQDLAQRMPR